MGPATLCKGRMNILWPIFSIPMYVSIHSVLISQKDSTKRKWSQAVIEGKINPAYVMVNQPGGQSSDTQ